MRRRAALTGRVECRSTLLRRRAGFTVIEVIVGLTVASLALAAGIGALGFVGERAQAAEAVTAAALEGATSRQLIVDWLTGTRVRSANGADGFQGLDIDYEGWQDDILLFPSTADTHLRAGETIVRFYIDRDDESPETGLVAELTTQRGLASRVVELVPGAGGLQVRYLPIANGAPVEWMDQWTARMELPRAVELTIYPADGVVLPPLLLYPIRVALGRQ